MKKLVSVLLCLVFAFSLVSAAAESSFDPTSNPWYWAWTESVKVYEDGTEEYAQSVNADPNLFSYQYFEFQPDGTGVETIVKPINQEPYERYEGAWTWISETQIRFARNEGEITYLFDYVDDELVCKEVYEGGSLFSPMKFTNTMQKHYTADEDNAIRLAIDVALLFRGY